MSKFEKFIGEPVLLVKQKLEDAGFVVTIKEFSKPKTNSEELLVVKVSEDGNSITLWSAGFKINFQGE